MPGAARANKIKLTTIPEKYEPPSHMTINAAKHKGMKNVEVKQKVKFRGHGVVRGIHASADSGHRVEMDIHHIEPDGDDA